MFINNKHIISNNKKASEKHMKRPFLWLTCRSG